MHLSRFAGEFCLVPLEGPATTIWDSLKMTYKPISHYGVVGDMETAALMDASVLMMPLVFFMAPTDPMLGSTVDAISRPVSQGGLLLDGMVYRYRPDTPNDGLEAGEGTFNVCTLWLIEALTRMGRVEEGHWLFEKMLTRANHLGLYPEETSPNGEQLGNFPQAFTHMGLISAAFNLNRALDLTPSAMAANVQSGGTG